MRRPVIFLLLALAVLLLTLIALPHLPDLAALRRLIARIAQIRAAHPFATAITYFCVYVGIASLALPLTMWMSLGAGALFGWPLGLLIVSFGASLGATCAMLISRHLLRDWVRGRIGARRMQIIDQGIARDGWLYLISLRLLPVIPFWAVNLGMGLTRIPVRVFYPLSQMAMLPASTIAVWTGTHLGRMDSLEDLFSPGLFIALTALALLPWIARAVIGRR